MALSVGAGVTHTCARLGTGGIVCWGTDALGQLGNGTTGASLTPARVRKLRGDARDTITIQAEPTPEPTAVPTPEPTPTPDPTAEPNPAP